MKKKAWGGRFQKSTDPVVEEFTASIHSDARMAEADVNGSIAHARMLEAQGILGPGEAETIATGLQGILQDLQAGSIELDPSCEDIHMFIERELTSRIGAVAGKLHTARSRNDQVALDFRLWSRQAAAGLDAELGQFQSVLLDLSSRHTDTILPGYTHLQRAQPVVLAHHLLAYFWMFQRDRGRLQDWRSRNNLSPLGSAALAGTSLPIDRDATAAALQFDGPIPNSLDAVSDRDFAAELSFICSLIMAHLSRMAEEVTLWATAEFGFLHMDDSVATGSSIMPQKKNPDVAELTRGKVGRVYGSLVSILTLLKGLPLAYMRDLQEDKPPLFDAVDQTQGCLKAMRRLLETSTFDTEAMFRGADDGFATATDLAEHLVRQGLPFRQAHEVVGNLVRKCLDDGRRLDSLAAEELHEAHECLGADAVEALVTAASVASRSHVGGTAPEAVRRQLQQAQQAFQEAEKAAGRSARG